MADTPRKSEEVKQIGAGGGKAAGRGSKVAVCILSFYFNF